MMEQYTAQQSSRPSLEVSQSVGGREGKKNCTVQKKAQKGREIGCNPAAKGP